MTRINCVPVDTLTDKHLVAEWKEIWRVFKLARPTDDIPPTYRMGKGHVLFFYNKLQYIQQRATQLYNEMLERGFSPDTSLLSIPNQYLGTKPTLFNNWVPTEAAMKINQQRLDERNGIAVKKEVRL